MALKAAYKLTYFNLRGLGEPARLLLNYGKFFFEDNRISEEEWPKIKDSMPMGQIPVLDVNDKRISQSIAISRFLGKKVGLAGSNDLEDAEIDSVVDSVNDLRQNIAFVHYEEDPVVQEKKRKVLNDEQIPFYLEKFEEIATENNGHLALHRTTWADFYFTGIKDYLNHMAKMDLTANHTNLKRVIKNVMTLEEIKEWLSTRPPNDY